MRSLRKNRQRKSTKRNYRKRTKSRSYKKRRYSRRRNMRGGSLRNVIDDLFTTPILPDKYPILNLRNYDGALTIEEIKTHLKNNLKLGRCLNSYSNINDANEKIGKCTNLNDIADTIQNVLCVT